MDHVNQPETPPRPGAGAAEPATERLLKRVQIMARRLALGGGFLILAAGALVAVEIFARKVLGTSTGVADELCSYALAIGSTMAFPYCLVERGHIRVDSVTRFLPAMAKTAIDLVALAALVGFFGVVAFYAIDTALVSFERTSRAVTVLRTPLYIPQGLWAVAYLLFVLTGAILLVAAVARLMRRDPRGVKSLVATRSGVDEAEAHL